LRRERARQERLAAAARAQPSLQLVGSDNARDLDLATLERCGVRLFGRLGDIHGARAFFGRDLQRAVHAADVKLERILSRIDAYIDGLNQSTSLRDRIQAAAHPDPIDTSAWPTTDRLDLAKEGIRTVIWATGFRRDYSWLGVPVLDGHGELVHARGVTPARGLYAMGLRLQHTRKSSFIDGVAIDAEYLATHITEHITEGTSSRAVGPLRARPSAAA